MFDADALDAVAGARLPLLVEHELGHDETRDALRAGRCVGGAGQHEVHDVVGHLVLAVGDEDLLTVDPE